MSILVTDHPWNTLIFICEWHCVDFLIFSCLIPASTVVSSITNFLLWVGGGETFNWFCLIWCMICRTHDIWNLISSINLWCIFIKTNVPSLFLPQSHIYYCIFIQKAGREWKTFCKFEICDNSSTFQCIIQADWSLFYCALV